MNQVSIEQLVAACHGTLVNGELSGVVTSVSTDTRKDATGAVFFALAGENFDAHNYLDKAIGQGASALVVSRVPEGVDFGSVVVIQVNDTLLGLQRFAAWYRQLLDLTVVAITGSNGKTSTKDFTRAVLGYKFRVTATIGNLNNHIGVPLTIVEANEMHEASVWEMGMNHPGEIAPLCEMTQPDIGIITNIGTAHIEYMGSREAIAEEKGTLARYLKEDGVLIVPADCDYGSYFQQRSKARTIFVGNGRGAVRAEDLKMSEDGSQFSLIIEGQPIVDVFLPVVGKHMVTNALLAAAAGHVMGMTSHEIASGLNQVELTSGRLRMSDVDGVRVIDDTYNANPESVKAAIDTLSEMELGEGRKFVVLGEMGELGEHTDNAYTEAGAYAAERQLLVVSVGEETERIHDGATSAGGESKHFATIDAAADWLQQTCVRGDAVLFKGSRAAAMERVMNKAFNQN